MIQEAQEIARATLAACPAFQSLVAADDATEALDRIYHDAFPAPESGRAEHTKAELTALRPCAVVYTEDNQGWVAQKDAAGSEDCWNVSGVVHFVIYRNVPDADAGNPSLVDTSFRTIIGNIASQIIGLSETAPYLAANRISMSGPSRTLWKDLSDIGDAQAAELIVNWGPSL